MYLSDARPPHNDDTKVINPFGLTPINALKVFPPLYDEYVDTWALMAVGVSVKNSVQSMITRVFGKHEKDGGEYLWTVFLLGHGKRGGSMRASRRIHARKILENVDI